MIFNLMLLNKLSLKNPREFSEMFQYNGHKNFFKIFRFMENNKNECIQN